MLAVFNVIIFSFLIIHVFVAFRYKFTFKIPVTAANYLN